ncbi:MAG TPA: bifunctional diaminohydroxyphosphoribosylaminopyrimidine deaminase/5-amino-6-(5-phosphoribosylamino)uracil reductase RibD [Pyrinomonadaceae bacterium]|nr:bifunctional diaminohydroxyphosphoribosylaminopyrimidine deaminase/5-amino-6-(5-phosphoribosylamino)uracil reductase RibD [Pyrinomonadaceae bacterium]
MQPQIKNSTAEIDERLMRRALELAARGAGQVSPSPLVGCVIARDDGETIGEGFYLYEGIKHAETLALEGAGERARGATAYVSLEPHAHQGRTPPCTVALIRAGVRRVVAPIEDPNPLVSGRGFAHLSAAGLEVEVGLLAPEAARLNEKYIHAMRHARPFVHLKLACSLDGRIATRTGDARWITNEQSRARVHLLRHEYDAILVGAGTAAADDPLLTDRSGLARHRPLTRIVLDDELRLSPDSRLAQTARETPLVIFTSATAAEPAAAVALESRGAEIVREPRGSRDLRAVLEELHRRSLQSVLVEGGARVAGMFLDAGLVDKVSFFVAPIIIGGSDAKPAVTGAGAARIGDAARLRDVEIRQHGSDVEITGYPETVNRES